MQRLIGNYTKEKQQLLDDHKRTVDYLMKEKAKVDGTLETTIKQTSMLEKKLDNLLIIIKEKMKPVGLFNNYLNNLKSKLTIYSPIEDDTIDIRLAEHLNSLPDSQSLTELFSRESQGIYHFGTKRVFLKIENGKIISIIFIHRSSCGWRILRFR